MKSDTRRPYKVIFRYRIRISILILVRSIVSVFLKIQILHASKLEQSKLDSDGRGADTFAVDG